MDIEVLSCMHQAIEPILYWTILDVHTTLKSKDIHCTLLFSISLTVWIYGLYLLSCLLRVVLSSMAQYKYICAYNFAVRNCSSQGLLLSMTALTRHCWRLTTLFQKISCWSIPWTSNRNFNKKRYALTQHRRSSMMHTHNHAEINAQKILML